jgi:hypothetical protein
MVELWRADPQARSRFDLRNPLRRRDFVLWLGREGKSLGLDQCSIAAALALLQRGTSLLRPAPQWGRRRPRRRYCQPMGRSMIG